MTERDRLHTMKEGTDGPGMRPTRAGTVDGALEQAVRDGLRESLHDSLHEELSACLREEVRAHTEKQRRTAKLYAASGTLALYAGGALVVAAGLAIALGLPGWAAALIVGVALGGFAMMLRQAARPRPPRTETRTAPPTTVPPMTGGGQTRAGETGAGMPVVPPVTPPDGAQGVPAPPPAPPAGPAPTPAPGTGAPGPEAPHHRG
ncbi:phage holin family protein [Streptomyces sp. NPDC059009]|uniref:phage holin family protein n=1 Tax=Streptomyces sp. NPDC059009 TaxID=3346694 RepID=UPI0036CD18A3